MKRDKREIKKSLGQHYLIDKHLLKKISDLVYKHNPKIIIEIGAGTGLLTQELLLKGGRVHAIEIEKKSLDELEKILDANEDLKTVDLEKKLSLQHGDALTISHSKLIENLLKDSLLQSDTKDKQNTRDEQKTEGATLEGNSKNYPKDKQEAKDEQTTKTERQKNTESNAEHKKDTSSQQEKEEGSTIEKNSIADQKNKQKTKSNAELQQGTASDAMPQQGTKAKQKNFPPTAMDFLPMAICGNLPYNIAARLIVKLLEEVDDFFSTTGEIFLEEQKFNLVFLIQKEVARRMLTPEQMLALKSKEKKSLISYLIAWYGKAKIHFDIKPNSFFPAPKVMSSVIEISINQKPMGEKEDYFFYKKCIKAAFQNRRKTLGKGLTFSLPEHTEALKSFFSKHPNLKKKRADDLTVEEYLKLAACVKENCSES